MTKVISFILTLLVFASAPVQAADRVAVYLDSTVRDTVGTTYVYRLREALTASPFFTMVSKETEATFIIGLVSLDIDKNRTAVGVTLAIENTNGYNYLVDHWLVTAGSDVLVKSAGDLLAAIDKRIRELSNVQ